MQRCPQCTRVYDNPGMFQPPVKTCLPCYARLPTNRRMWEVVSDPASTSEQKQRAWREIRLRAVRSRYAHKHRVANVMQTIGASDIGDQVREIGLEGAGGVDLSPHAMVKCDGCEKPFVQSKLNEFPGPGDLRPLLCKDCTAAASCGDLQKKCYLCHQLTPFAAMYTDGAGKFFCAECSPKMAAMGV